MSTITGEHTLTTPVNSPLQLTILFNNSPINCSTYLLTLPSNSQAPLLSIH